MILCGREGLSRRATGTPPLLLPPIGCALTGEGVDVVVLEASMLDSPCLSLLSPFAPCGLAGIGPGMKGAEGGNNGQIRGCEAPSIVPVRMMGRGDRGDVE